MKKMAIALGLALCLMGWMMGGALAQTAQVTTAEALSTALGDAAAEAVEVTADLEVPGEMWLTADKPIVVKAGAKLTIRHPAQGGFASLQLLPGGSLTLEEGAALATVSDFSMGASIAQVWVDGGALDAENGVIEPGSTVFIASGEVKLPPERTDVSVSGGVTSQEGLIAALAEDSPINYVIVMGSFDVTEEIAVTCEVALQDGAVLTLREGGALRVTPDGTLRCDPGSAVVYGKSFE